MVLALLGAPSIAAACKTPVAPMLVIGSVGKNPTSFTSPWAGPRPADPFGQPYTRAVPVTVAFKFSTDFSRHRAANIQDVTCPELNSPNFLMLLLHGGVKAVRDAIVHQR